MPEPISVALFFLGLKAATYKTVAAPVAKGVIASTSAALHTSGTVHTVASAALLGTTVTGAVMYAIWGIIHKAVEGGYLPDGEGQAYGEKIEKMPLYQQQKILANIEGTAGGLLKYQFNRNGVYA
jgi:hypothetical protein